MSLISRDYNDGVKAYDAGDYKKAVKLLSKYLKTNNNDVYTLCMRGNSYLLLGDSQSAMNDLNEAVKLDPTDSWALSSRAECFRMVDKYQEALDDFSKVLQLDSSNSWALGLRGDCYRRLGKFQEGIDDEINCLQLDPQSAFALYTRGQCFKHLGKYEDALQDFDAVLAMDPKFMNTTKQKEEVLSLLNPKTKPTSNPVSVTRISAPAPPTAPPVYKVQCWHFDKALQESPDWVQMDKYLSLPLTPVNAKEYTRFMQIVPVTSGPTFLSEFEPAKVDLIWNKEMQKVFEEKVKMLQSRVEKEFQPTWHQEEHVPERLKLMQRLQHYVSHFPPQPGNVKVVPVWFGTTLAMAQKICISGFADCFTNRKFGRGIYFTNSAEHALKVYSPKDHVAVLCWVALGNTYPVINNDQSKLSNVPQYKNYDCYYIPVSPVVSSADKSVNYLPPVDTTIPPKYDIHVVLHEAHILPRYVVHFVGKKASLSLPTSPTDIKTLNSVKTWKVNEVCNWLTSIGLSQDYSKIFVKQAIDGDVLLTLTTDDLKELGITTFGDLRKLQKGIKELQ